MAEFWLRFAESDLCWAMFRENGNGSMKVLAVISSTEVWHYEALPREDARHIWRKLRLLGYERKTTIEVRVHGMSAYALGLRALPAKHRPRR